MSSPQPKTGNAYSATCPTRLVLDQIADKWTVLILGALLDGPVRFNELKRRLEGVSQKVLGAALRKLERNGLVSRTAYPTVPTTVEYSLTGLGQALAQLTTTVRIWAERHIREVIASQESYDREASAGGDRKALPQSPARGSFRLH